MIQGTHNSGTGGELVWWLHPFAPILHATSRCQDKSIARQLHDGVRLFNLQITLYRGHWHFSHGLCIYKERVEDALELMRATATVLSPIYFQLYLDKNFFCGQARKEFTEFVERVKKDFCTPCLTMLSAWIEGTDTYPHKDEKKIDKRENYWTKAWARTQARNIIDRLPLPLRHAKAFNASYREQCTGDYLMLDFYNI